MRRICSNFFYKNCSTYNNNCHMNYVKNFTRIVYLLRIICHMMADRLCANFIRIVYFLLILSQDYVKNYVRIVSEIPAINVLISSRGFVLPPTKQPIQDKLLQNVLTKSIV